VWINSDISRTKLKLDDEVWKVENRAEQRTTIFTESDMIRYENLTGL